MSMHDRAAQFSPFAALTGFDGVIAETGRMTDRKIELSESQKLLLDQKLTLIDDVIPALWASAHLVGVSLYADTKQKFHSRQGTNPNSR